MSKPHNTQERFEKGGTIDLYIISGNKLGKQNTLLDINIRKKKKTYCSYKLKAVANAKDEPVGATEEAIVAHPHWKHRNLITINSSDFYALQITCKIQKHLTWRKLGSVLLTADMLQSGQHSIQDHPLDNNNDYPATIKLGVRYCKLELANFISVVHKLDADDAIDCLKKDTSEINPNAIVQFKTMKNSLHYAAIHNWIEIVQILIEKGVHINTVDRADRTALSYACENNNMEIVQLLLDAKADVTIEDREEAGALHYACAGARVELVSLLLENQCDPTASTSRQKKPLHFAAQAGNAGVVRLLLEKDVFVDPETEHDASTPLIYAAKENHYECSKVLLDHDANVNHHSYLSSPILIAIRNSNTKMVRLFLKKKYHLNLNACSDAMLMTAIEVGNVHVLRVIMPHVRESLNNIKNDCAPIHKAVLENKLEIFEYLLAEKADPNLALPFWKDFKHVSPIIIAIRKKSMPFIKALIAHGHRFNINITTYWDLYKADNITPLHLAIFLDEKHIVRLLLAQPEIVRSVSTQLKSSDRALKALTPEELAYHLGLTHILTEIQGGKKESILPHLNVPKFVRSVSNVTPIGRAAPTGHPSRASNQKQLRVTRKSGASKSFDEARPKLSKINLFD